MKPIRTLAVLGTRPEAIKMVPVIQELQKNPHTEAIVVSTAQHREMLDQVLDLFGIVPDVDLGIMQPRQTLNNIVGRAIDGLDRVMDEVTPDVVLVQGDTTTAFAASLAAFNRRIPVGHVEAGLRSFDLRNPYPEEGNRRLISGIASMHFAPTRQSVENLKREGLPEKSIYLTGNTVVDCLQQILKLRKKPLVDFLPAGFHSNGHKMILITAHRRENWHGPMEELCGAVADLAAEFSDISFLYPVHMNPVVRETVYPMLSGLPNVALINPLPYGAFVEAMAKSHLILTDSGGVQEEAPSLGRPVLVLRDTTERPEGVTMGAARLVGMQREKIVAGTRRLLNSTREYRSMASGRNPYGDGLASERVVKAVLHWFGVETRPEPFGSAPFEMLLDQTLRVQAHESV